MTWISDKKLTWYESVCMNVLKTGQVPRHVAFIMDGNRRYAKRNHIEKTEGHARGFTKLSETLKWCRDLGVTEVTVYAFSIENFRRPQSEIDGIMNLAREKFELLLKERDKLSEHGVCIRFIGDLSLLPADIQRQTAEVMLMTRNNKAARLNIAFSYTAREEISRAVRDVAAGVSDGHLWSSDVTERLVEQCLYTRESPRPDLLVRTSGEVRLSDFLLWQTTHTCIFFTEVLWPDFSIWHLFSAVFTYQRNYDVIQAARADRSLRRLQHSTDGLLPGTARPGDSVTRPGDSAGESLDSTDSGSECAADDRVDSASQSAAAQKRVQSFLSHLDAARWGRLESLVAEGS
ncbi:dehydrodolichyl diphosphate synthase complex subunit DHDDS-like [Amphibalanus amphitrite]|uniref:dehydrodolichyl diphosphate synthase complex subunit DHDDS-like n=1 Tax=Amphibalanus amphitrite TaxID=1232801 RepID=UPI001C9157F5|nr:dehydrodolichyl diphosphate synthase complex subunit DHDDS-like [Amphibalanus amphitrite]XP_043210419.1 dehydrodolichyl diphosphate synthase complex subunit DHDDS-like [Amphibalanus amphitrite]XP_043210420.1 dehydrodolichyl diphosphate synthase complex subunit DHDDS-like [Amphibalanus amphitrite]XP_043210421.1 dehydrodolichyl diphosphate synthase complex subunit DHDDS-like [Amphibalanus amphitrite]